jgi:catechol 2,3-dioxygenase
MSESQNASRAGDPADGVAAPGFRMPPGLRLGPVKLQVADLSRSLRFYEQVLGLRPLERSADRLLLGAEQQQTALVELREARAASPVPQRGRLGLYHYAILLPAREDLGRFVSHLERLGIRAGASDHLVSEALYLSDPDGHGIEVYADRPRAEWRHQDGQIVMATARLDLAELARAGGEQPWQGMPPGTRMGHIHLHVGDLERAERFYHRGLGLDRVVWSYPGALFLSAGGYHHHLGVNTWAAPTRPANEGEARLLEWVLILPDSGEVAAAARSLEEGGHAVEAEAHGDVLTRDPWGTALRLTATSG